jgi:protein-S-isoprenylcysteine O-methyltransferase Ste14
MEKRGFLERHGVVRSSIRKDLIQFALPALTVLIIELLFCVSDGLSNFWGAVWGLIKQPGDLSLLPVQSILGLALFFTGLTIMLVGQTTLWRNYSGTVLIREDHQLITHGIYRFTRNPIYLGGIMALTGIPAYAASLYGFLSSLILIPIILNRIRLEEELLTQEFQDAFVRYKGTTKKLIPFIY